jgi:plastocyanin
MSWSRRHVLKAGGAVLAGLLAPRAAVALDVVEIRMQGHPDGSHVWFDPVGIRVETGQTIRWLNLDPGNSHTATAYHPRNFDHPLRIPEAADPWDSDYLLPHETFSVRLTVEGIYDFFCIPHEHAGMVGRIIVGHPARSPAPGTALGASGSMPEVALRAFPSVDEIMRRGVVHRT